MGLFDALGGKEKPRPEEVLRKHVLQVMEVLEETEGLIDSLTPDLRQSARRSFDQDVGESVGECRKRLEKMERKLLQGDLGSIPRPELTGLRERMVRLDEHLISTYLQTMKLVGDRQGRRAIRASAKRRAEKVEDLLKALDRAMR
jgi:hypothetical protein